MPRPPQAFPHPARQGLAEIDPNRVIAQQPASMGKPRGSLPTDVTPSLPVPASVTPAALSRKRKSDSIENRDNNATPQHPAIIYSDPARVEVTDDCDAIRRKIRDFVDSGEMKVGEFQRAIGVSSNAYSTFMKQAGASAGQRSSVYKNALAFFEQRQLIGPSNVGPAKASKRAKKDNTTKDLDVSGITLPGEEDGRVPVYDTCNEIRRKIRAFLKKEGTTQAGFCRELTKMVAHQGRKVNASSLTNFLGQKGPSGGSGSVVFYAAYVYFEKIRVRDGKPKSQMRQEMEDVWGWGGMDIPEDGKGRAKYWICVFQYTTL